VHGAGLTDLKGVVCGKMWCVGTYWVVRWAGIKGFSCVWGSGMWGWSGICSIRGQHPIVLEGQKTVLHGFNVRFGRGENCVVVL
jgi:hypothetical protein